MSKSRPTQMQMKSLVELMTKDPVLSAGKFTQTFTQKLAKQKWEVIAEQLNALPGAEKSWDKWRKTWQDTRSATKTKAAAIKRHIGGTGGGPSCSIQLNDIQQDALLLISPASVSGHSQSKESMVEFTYETPENDVTLDTDNFFIEEVDIESDDENENDPITTPNHIAANDKWPITSPKPGDNENENSITVPNPIAANDKRPIIIHKPGVKTKMSTGARLAESNLAANRLGDISEKKINLKADYYKKKLKLMEDRNIYYEKKLKLMEDKNVIFKNLTTVLTTLSEKLPNKQD